MVGTLSRFCCGLNLKHGTIIIGVVQSILAFMFLILSAAYAEHPHELVDMTDESVLPNLHTLRVVLILISVASGLQCIFSILLIFGAETNRPILLIPWLIFNPLAIFVYIILTLIAVIHHTGINNTPFIVGHLIIASALSLVAAYKILAVRSYYLHLRGLNF